MRVLIFGATGMVVQGVLLECLRDPAVTRVLAVGDRQTLGMRTERLPTEARPQSPFRHPRAGCETREVEAHSRPPRKLRRARTMGAAYGV